MQLPQHVAQHAWRRGGADAWQTPEGAACHPHESAVRGGSTQGWGSGGAAVGGGPGGSAPGRPQIPLRPAPGCVPPPLVPALRPCGGAAGLRGPGPCAGRVGGGRQQPEAGAREWQRWAPWLTSLDLVAGSSPRWLEQSVQCSVRLLVTSLVRGVSGNGQDPAVPVHQCCEG